MKFMKFFRDFQLECVLIPLLVSMLISLAAVEESSFSLF